MPEEGAVGGDGNAVPRTASGGSSASGEDAASGKGPESRHRRKGGSFNERTGAKAMEEAGAGSEGEDDVGDIIAGQGDEKTGEGEKKGGFFGRLGFGSKKKAAESKAEEDQAEERTDNQEDDEEEEGEEPDSEDEAANSNTGSATADKDDSKPKDATPTDSQDEASAAGKEKRGVMGMFRGMFGSKNPPHESAGSDASSDDTPPKKFGKLEMSSPRKNKAKAPVSAVQRAVDKSIFVKMGRLTRAVFWRDSAMQTGKEGSIDLSKIAAANKYSIRGLQQSVYTMQWQVMILALIGLFSGIWVNEWCWLGYIPTPEEEMSYCTASSFADTAEACRSAGGTWSPGITNPLLRQRCRNPDDPQVYIVGIILKSLCSALTGILLMSIFHLYECIAVELCFRNHLEYHREFVDVPFWNLGLLPEFMLEVLVCIVHPGPRLHFNMGIEARGRFSVYNSESILVGWMFIRMYTVWRYYREWMFMRYTSKNFASRLSDVSMDSKLAIKAILADVPFQTIISLFIMMTFVLAYLVRIAEAPANIQHVYFWNQLWLIVVTATSTGYGDLYPLTHLGRFVCIIAMIGGIVLTAILITAVSTNLELNAGEHRLMNFLQSEHWEQQLKIAACRSIQSWWRRAIFHPRTLQALRNFKNKKKAYRKFLEATPHFGSFVESMKQDTEVIRTTLAQVQNKVVSGIDLGQLNKGNAGISGLAGGGGRAGAAAAVGAMGGNPVPSKVFEELMIELAQIRKANTQLKGIIDKGSINVQSGGGGYHGPMGSTTPGRSIMRAESGGESARFQRVPSSGGPHGGIQRTPSAYGGASSYRNRGGHESARSGGGTARSGQAQFYGNDPAVIASKAVEERVRRLEIQINNLDKGMAKCLGQIVRLLQGLY